MEFTSFQEHIEHQFDAFCKKALKFKIRDIHKAIARLAVRLNFDIAVQDELMAEALVALPEDNRRIVLLYYFLGMNDREIGELLNLIRETVQYRRISSLKQLKQF